MIELVQDFKDLVIWKKSIELTIIIYKLTTSFPENEKYNLISQIRRATTSISTNIAEGAGRRTKKDFVKFLYNAYGSIKEVESLLLLSEELNYLDNNMHSTILQSIDELSRMLFRFIEAVR